MACRRACRRAACAVDMYNWDEQVSHAALPSSHRCFRLVISGGGAGAARPRTASYGDVWDA